MRDRMNRQRDAVLHSNFAHQFGYVGFYSAFFDAEGGADFFIGAAGYQHLEHFFFTIGKSNAAGGEDASGGRADAFDEG